MTDTAPTTEPKATRKRAPRKAAADRAPAKTGRPSAEAKLAKELGEQIAAIGIVVTAFHEADGMTIVSHADAVGASLARLAEQNPKVKKVLSGALETAGWSGVAVAVAPIVLEIASHHLAPRPPAEPADLDPVSPLFPSPPPVP